MHRWRSAALAPILLAYSTSLAGCFASKSDFNQLRDEIAVVRAETATVDSVRAMQMVQLLSTLRAVTDSLGAINTRLTRLRAESQSGLRDLGNRVLQAQEASGQSQQSLREMRAALEARDRAAAAAATAPASPSQPVPGTPDSTPPVVNEPGPNELFQLGRDQLARGGFTAAQAAFADLLKRYPDSELAADAQFYLAEALAGGGKAAAADTAYATVVKKYPTSLRAATALYKRGVAQQKAGRTTTARRTFNEVIRLFPESDEAALARERLRGTT